MTVKIPLIQGQSTKLELNNANDALFLAGQRGLSKIFLMDPSQEPKPVFTNRLDKAAINLKKNSKGQLLIQQPGTNDLVTIDDSANERDRCKGKYEPGPVNEAFSHFRHSLDDKYIIWKNGLNDIEVVDCEIGKPVEMITNFWSHRGKPCLPQSAVSNREVSKILGLSQLDPNTQVLHYIDKDSQTTLPQSLLVKEAFPSRSHSLTK